MKDIELVDKEFLRILQNRILEEFGTATIVADIDGSPVMEGIGFTRLCKDYIRSTPLGLERCKKCDALGGRNSYLSKKEVVYRCHAGLIDFASPIMMGEKQIGCFLGGQILDKEIDMKHFELLGEDLGVQDIDGYREAVKEVAVVSRYRIEENARLINELAYKLSDFMYAYSKISKTGHVCKMRINELEMVTNNKLLKKENLGLKDFFQEIKKEFLKKDIKDENKKNFSREVYWTLTEVSNGEIKLLSKIKSIKAAFLEQFGH